MIGISHFTPRVLHMKRVWAGVQVKQYTIDVTINQNEKCKYKNW